MWLLNIYIISIITATTWFIWKSRCDAIFRNLSPNFSAIICRALAHVQDHSIGGKDLLGQRLFLNNFSSTDGQFLFYHMRINHKTQVRMIGFFIANAIMLFLLQAVVHTRSLNIPLMIYLSLKLLSKWHWTFMSQFNTFSIIIPMFLHSLETQIQLLHGDTTLKLLIFESYLVFTAPQQFTQLPVLGCPLSSSLLFMDLIINHLICSYMAVIYLIGWWRVSPTQSLLFNCFLCFSFAVFFLVSFSFPLFFFFSSIK